MIVGVAALLSVTHCRSGNGRVPTRPWVLAFRDYDDVFF